MQVLLTVLLFAALCNILVAYPTSQVRGNVDEEGDYFEGDMDLTDEQLNEILNPNKRNGVKDDKYKWPGAVVFYEIEPIFDEEHVEHIKKAFVEIEKVSCIRFYPRKKSTKHFILITGEDSGCHSRVGFQRRGQQNLNLKPGPIGKHCFKLGTIIHETIHALGFHHQQCTHNRDHFITIIEENIKDNHKHNFRKYNADVVSNFGITYDYESIMHYSEKAFSKNGKKTIIPHDKNAVIGQRNGLSAGDIQKLNLMYKCPGRF